MFIQPSASSTPPPPPPQVLFSVSRCTTAETERPPSSAPTAARPCEACPSAAPPTPCGWSSTPTRRPRRRASGSRTTVSPQRTECGLASGARRFKEWNLKPILIDPGPAPRRGSIKRSVAVLFLSCTRKLAFFFPPSDSRSPSASLDVNPLSLSFHPPHPPPPLQLLPWLPVPCQNR